MRAALFQEDVRRSALRLSGKAKVLAAPGLGALGFGIDALVMFGVLISYPVVLLINGVAMTILGSSICGLCIMMGRRSHRLASACTSASVVQSAVPLEPCHAAIGLQGPSTSSDLV